MMLASIAERERFRPKVKNIRRDIERWPGGLFFKVAQIAQMAQILIRRRIMAGAFIKRSD